MIIQSPGFDPASLDIVEQNGAHLLYSNDRPLMTPGGRLWSHGSERLMKAVLAELLLSDNIDPDAVTLATLFEYLTDSVLNNPNDPFGEQLSERLSEDPIIRTRQGGGQPMANNEPVLADNLSFLFNFHFWSSSSLMQALNRFTQEQMYRVEDREEVKDPVESLISDLYLQATPEMRAAMRLLAERHRSWVILPMLLVFGQITPGEYSRALISLGIRQTGSSISTKDYPRFVRDASAVNDFLATVATREEVDQRVASYLAEGEGDLLEYKSTLRWDLRAGKTSQAIERACLKTIAAFLNTNGGVLLIGIRDDGSVEGIETDRFPNDDKFLLHLWTLIRTCLGRDVSPHIVTRLEKREEKTLCIVRCTPSSRPVFLRQPGFNEEFYIRVGPGSAAMDISEALRYIADHFPG